MKKICDFDLFFVISSCKRYYFVLLYKEGKNAGYMKYGKYKRAVNTHGFGEYYAKKRRH